MTFTIHFTGWVVPASITAILWLAAVFIAVRDSKCCGDYGIPLLGFGALVGAFVGTVIAWLVFFLT